MLDGMFDILDRSGTTPDKATMYSNRRKGLLSLIEQEHSGKKGKVVLFAPFEQGIYPFLQESSYWYYSGISEPATALVFDNQSGTSLYRPNFDGLREKWVHSAEVLNKDTIALFGIDEMCDLGKPVQGYQLYPYFSKDDYQNLIDMIRDVIAQNQVIFTLYPTDKYQYVQVRQIIDRLAHFIPELHQHIVDISPQIAQMRRKKEMGEIEHLYQAIGITYAGFQAAARLMQPGAKEAELQAAMEYIFTENGGKSAYPSIVAGGKRATILHYHANNQELKDGEAVLIDAGAMFNHYCADITRVFPVSGTFTDRQRDLYNIVLETQQHVVEHIRPGVWIANPQEQDRSLHHIAMNYLKKQGYDSYFIHGIGHYLGLDVHDVGDRMQPLQEGDVITVEPGVYIPDESIGIRIEDNYWVVADAEPVCLSDDIPKTVQAVEEMVQESF